MPGNLRTGITFRHKKRVDPEMLEAARAAAARGCTRVEQAKACGMGMKTFYLLLHESKELREAVDQGERDAVEVVESAIFKNATEPAKDPKTGAPVGPPAGSVDAQKFFLTRRGGERWRDPVVDEGEGQRSNVRVTIVLPDNARQPKVIDASPKRLPQA